MGGAERVEKKRERGNTKKESKIGEDGKVMVGEWDFEGRG